MIKEHTDDVAYSYGYVERRVSTRNEFSLSTPTIMDKLPKIGLKLPQISLYENLELSFC